MGRNEFLSSVYFSLLLQVFDFVAVASAFAAAPALCCCCCICYCLFVCLFACCCFRGDSWWKTSAILLACLLRCLVSPLFGLSNFLASVAEGFANTLMGDFEQFTRVQERADLDKKHKHHLSPSVAGGGSMDVTGTPAAAAAAGLRAAAAAARRNTKRDEHATLAARFRRNRKQNINPTRIPGRRRIQPEAAKVAAAAAAAAAGNEGAATKTRAGNSFAGAFRRPSSKQVTFAV